MRFHGYQYCTATLEYNPENQQLQYKCDCNKKNLVCNHIVAICKHISKNFGADFFNPNFLDHYKTHFLKTYNLTLQDPYQKYFDFSLSKSGVKVESKFKNVISSLDEFFSTENKIQAQASTSTESYGFAGVFAYGKKYFKHFYLTRGKLNKSGDELISKFEILEDELTSNLIHVEGTKIRELFLKTIQINKLYSDFENFKHTNNLMKCGKLFKEVVRDFSDITFYEYSQSDSLTKKNLHLVSLEQPIPVKIFLKIVDNELFYTLKSYITVLDKNYNLSTIGEIKLFPFYIKLNQQIYPIENTEILLDLHQFKKKPELNFVKSDLKKFLVEVVQPLSKKYEIDTKIIAQSPTIDLEEHMERQVYIKDLDDQTLTFKLIVKYPNGLIDALSPEKLIVEKNLQKDTFEFAARNPSFEDNFIEDFKSLHPDFEDQNTLMTLSVAQVLENFWLIHATEKMKQMGISVFGVNELKSFKFNINKPTISMGVKSDIDWFDLEMHILFGTQKASLKEVQKAILKKSNYVSLDDGTLGVLPEEWIKKMAIYFKSGEVKKDQIKLSNFQFGIIDELYMELENKPKFLKELYEKKQRLLHIESVEPIKIPKGVKAQLRPYQQHGLNWLNFLDTHQLGGCLADDMGLGKTLQALTFIKHLISVKKINKPILIIAPTSLMFNWRNEIEKFTPDLKYLIYTGAKRTEKSHEILQYQLIISTYGTLLNDVESLQDIEFQYVILDESQAIKNPNSKRYKAVRLLKAKNRLVLTGTPIENNTFDLYAQLNFLNPGLLGSIAHFKTNFSDDIDKAKNHETSHLLSKMISPFILRRTKEQVANDLPEKIESVIYCEMGKEQRAVYEQFKEKYRDYLLHKINEDGIQKSQMYILEGLTKLRQICNSTAILSDEEDYGNYSAKLEILMENITQKTGEHKILIFSQFVKMLQQVKNRLDQDNIPYEYLDGQTTDRENRVQNFQNESHIRVFLISLKAGGTGLNLTEADYVFIIDPWWNPAVENQAIDRTHRIGQKRNVMAYRMICKDSIEEKIMLLQQKKKKIANDIIQIDQESKSFDLHQVKELFS